MIEQPEDAIDLLDARAGRAQRIAHMIGRRKEGGVWRSGARAIIIARDKRKRNSEFDRWLLPG